MPTIRRPRKGSLAYWPRRHAKRAYPRISTYLPTSKVKLAGFAGYKAGMTHVFISDNRPNSLTKNKKILFPVTILECPPLKVTSIRLYAINYLSSKVAAEVSNLKSVSDIEKNFDKYTDVRVNVSTQPKFAGFGKKKPEVFELGIGGNKIKDKYDYAKNILGKEVTLTDIFKEGEQLDIFSVSKGKGTQGPVKRFGIGLRASKSEKGRRGPANIGPWKGNRSWTVSHAGRTGFYTRHEKNKWILKIGNKPQEINVAGGFVRYGNIKSTYMLLKGSLPGATKRLIRVVNAYHHNHKIPTQAPSIEMVSLVSNQR